MSRKIRAPVLAFLSLIMTYGTLQAVEIQEGLAGKPVPVITQSFASTEIRPGETWKIYLNASDIKGEMKNFFAIVDQPGVGQYPLSIIRIKKENRKELSGYLYLYTSTTADPLDFVNLKLTIYIRDRLGTFSQPAVFPLSIQSRFYQSAPAAGIFQEQSLGPIMVKLKRGRGGKGKG